MGTDLKEKPIYCRKCKTTHRLGELKELSDEDGLNAYVCEKSNLILALLSNGQVILSDRT